MALVSPRVAWAPQPVGTGALSTRAAARAASSGAWHHETAAAPRPAARAAAPHDQRRREHAAEITEVDLFGYAIGGLSVGESKEDMAAALGATTVTKVIFLPPSVTPPVCARVRRVLPVVII